MILYIGQYRGGNDGWSIAAKNYLKALQATGLDIASRPIFMNGYRNPDGQIWDTEKAVTEKPKIVIQNVIADHFECMPGYNIGITSTETKRLNNNFWIYKINLLDELWVNSESEKETLQNSGVTIKISVIPMPIDTDYLEGNLDNIEKLAIPELEGRYVFYFIGEHNDRSNVKNLIRAFNLEFTSRDNVNLLLKTSVGGINPQQANKNLYEEIRNIKASMRIHGNPQSYPAEIIITHDMTEEQMLSVHKLGNCFVSASYCESISIPALYATYMDRSVIVTQGTHLESLMKGACATVKSIEVPVITDTPPLPHIYTAHERWMQPDILDLGRVMRKEYDYAIAQQAMTGKGKEYILNNFSYKSTAAKIKENLSWAL